MSEVVTVTMNPAVDMIVELAALAPYEVNKARGERVFCGGKGLNVSLVLSLLGVKNTACGFLGADNAEAFRAFCGDNGIDFGFRLLPGRTRTNVKLAVDNHPATDINLPGLPVTEKDVANLTGDLVGRAGRETLFILSGSLPPGTPVSIYADLVKRLRREGSRVYVDASGAALALALEAKPDLAKPNHEELLDLEAGSDKSLPAILAAARKHVGPTSALAVSMGSHGALWVSGTESYNVRPAPVKALNMVGAGDTFLAGMVYGETRGWTPDKRLAFANALAGHWVEKMERTVLDRARVEELSEATKAEKV